MLDKIEAMRQKQLAIATAKKEAYVTERRKQWEDVKEFAPEMAEFMTNIKKNFGKPEKALVVLSSGLVLLKHGE